MITHFNFEGEKSAHPINNDTVSANVLLELLRSLFHNLSQPQF